MRLEEPMDLKRVQELPEKVKVDLALAFLAALLEQRRSCLSRHGAEECGEMRQIS